MIGARGEVRAVGGSGEVSAIGGRGEVSAIGGSGEVQVVGGREEVRAVEGSGTVLAVGGSGEVLVIGGSEEVRAEGREVLEEEVKIGRRGPGGEDSPGRLADGQGEDKPHSKQKYISIIINLSVDSCDVSSFFQMCDRVIHVLPWPFL